jgi:hypothetical protein
LSTTTYSQLKTDIADWLNRGDLTVQIPSFIRLAEARFQRDLRVRQMVKRSVADLEQGYITLPGDWLEAKNIQINSSRGPFKLEYVTLEAADDLRLRRGDTAGIPQYFNVTGNQLEVIPSPSGTPEIEMTYYARIPALSDANPSNWLLETWPDMYLYGSLAHSAPYLKDDERVATWAAFYDRALEEITDADARAQYSGSVLKSRARVLG